MYLSIVLLVIFVACFASLMNSGMWSNTITLINVITSGLLAMNYFEPLAEFLDKQAPSWTYVWDFVSLWFVFGISMLALRGVTDLASKIQVKFHPKVERIGGLLMAVWASWIVLCFATATLHAAPLARNFLGGAFQPEPEAKMLFGLQPDRVWLGWVNRESKGALRRLGTAAPFDQRGDFILRYAERRAEFEQQRTLTKSSGS
jgi:hypothetical protein